MNSETPAWGAFSPPPSTLGYRLLTGLGLSRGKICRWVRSRWISRHSTTVDAERRGVRYRLDIRNNTTDAKILTSSRFYDRVEIEALSAGEKGVFVDLGANTGYYSLMLAKRGFRRVIAIEPNPPARDLLSFNIAANQMENTITLVPLCVGEPGRMPFYCAGGLGGASLIQPKTDTAPIWVDSAPLLAILEQQGITEIDAMKVDIEGYEDAGLLPFFTSAPRSLWPTTVVLEHCNRDNWKQDVIARMVEAGYRKVRETHSNTILQAGRASTPPARGESGQAG